METKENVAVEDYDFGALSFPELMNELIDIRGYRAAAIVAHDGELLYSNTAGELSTKTMSVFVDVLHGLFGLACQLSEKSGFVSCEEMALKTSDEVMVIRCSGKDCLVGIRLLVVIEALGNIAIMQRQLGNLLPRLMRCLTWEPDNLLPLYMRESSGRRSEEKIPQNGKTIRAD